MKKSILLFFWFVGVNFVGTGCYSPKPIPKAYFDQNIEMNVTIGKCSQEAKMRDSGQGGLVGALVTGVKRAGDMRNAMEGINGDTVRELVRQRFESAIEEYFTIFEEGKLKTVIDIDQWGWYAPTTVAGIRTGSYQFTLSGTISITDPEVTKKKGLIATCKIATSEAIGNKPTAAVSQEAFLKCADKFATEAVKFLIKEKDQL